MSYVQYEQGNTLLTLVCIPIDLYLWHTFQFFKRYSNTRLRIKKMKPCKLFIGISRVELKYSFRRTYLIGKKVATIEILNNLLTELFIK